MRWKIDYRALDGRSPTSHEMPTQAAMVTYAAALLRRGNTLIRAVEGESGTEIGAAELDRLARAALKAT